MAINLATAPDWIEPKKLGLPEFFCDTHGPQLLAQRWYGDNATLRCPSCILELIPDRVRHADGSVGTKRVG